VNDTEYIIEATSKEDATQKAILQMVNKETDGFLLESPDQMFAIEEIK